MLFGTLSAGDSAVTSSEESIHQKYFRYGSSNIPHADKRYKGGEDAWIAQEDLLVVADGVGGWEAHGIDSGLFSK